MKSLTEDVVNVQAHVLRETNPEMKIKILSQSYLLTEMAVMLPKKHTW